HVTSIRPPPSSTTARNTTASRASRHSTSCCREWRGNHDRAPMQVERPRLAGVQYFLQTAELAIQPGLTGIVGPNGCGKSNLVEALRWVMGEASPKRLRGGEMDDVIFAGSGSRPARNLAEVALTIDNSARDAPFAYNEGTTIEVVRRIARGGGSAFRI